MCHDDCSATQWIGFNELTVLTSVLDQEHYDENQIHRWRQNIRAQVTKLIVGGSIEVNIGGRTVCRLHPLVRSLFSLIIEVVTFMKLTSEGGRYRTIIGVFYNFTQSGRKVALWPDQTSTPC